MIINYMNTTERKEDLLKIISQLDISPTLFKNASEKYNSIVKLLESHGLEADMYPQGSFALGTVIRPYSKENDRNYDLDFICQVHNTRDEITPSELREQVSNILKNSDQYDGKFLEYDECFTIEFADINGVGFSIDIVPAADETISTKSELRLLSQRPWLIDTSIAIPRHCQLRVYDWITNNPKGYRTWFDSINAPFRNASRNAYRQNLLNSFRDVYSSVEEIPEEMERTSMQRVIQILKYHRDVYFSKLSNGDELKPISAIINTIVAEISKSANSSYSVFELLEYVINELVIYSNLLHLSPSEFSQKYSNRKLFSKDKGVWRIENPANPKDNLANKWNKNPEIAHHFFLWINAVKNQLIDSLTLDDAIFRSKAETAFGHKIIKKVWKDKYNPNEPKSIPTDNPTRPWRLL